MKTEIQLLLLLLMAPLLLFADSHDDWKLESDREGIQIFTRQVDGAKYKQVKGVTLLQAPMEQVSKILTDFDHHSDWIDHVSESRVISKSNDSTMYVYTMEETVWPAQNRYHVSKMEVERSDRQCTINFEVIPDYMEKRDDGIQMKRQKGFWKLTSTDDGQCNVEFFVDKNPGGYIPSWLVNSMIVDTPFNMLENLKNALDRHSGP